MEWTINVEGERPTKLVPSNSYGIRAWSWVRDGFVEFLKSCWRIGANEPKKFMHCVKVSVALCVVSLFYYMTPLYDGFGGNAMWAIITVVVVFEYTVGATLYKCINRTIATVVGGSLGFGVNWVASQSGDKFEPYIVAVSIFIFGGSATFIRFIPKVKARYDYGASIFILTFSLVAVSGYRVDKLLPLACERMSTIMVGTCLCIFISMLFCPAWAGESLHNSVILNLDKLATSLQACVDEYFNTSDENCKEEEGDAITKKCLAYKCVLNSAAGQDAMANFAIWEPAHGKFKFGHPWKCYQNISSASRNLACCIDTLNICINSELEVPEPLKKMVEDECLKVSSYSSKVLKEVASMIRETKKSRKIETLVADLNFAVQELHNAIKCVPKKLCSSDSNGAQTGVSLLEILPLAAMVSFLTEAVSRIEEIVDQANGFAKVAKFSSKGDAKKDQQENESSQEDDSHILDSLDNQETNKTVN